MMTTTMQDAIWAVVPAAGKGQRMGAALPKQYLPLNQKTVLEHTLQRLLDLPLISGVTVALSGNDEQFKRLHIAQNERVNTIIGGKNRCDSVLAALNSLQKKAKLSDWVMVHDAARPCIRLSALNDLIHRLQDLEVGGILGIPASDTLKQVGGQHTIETTLSRENVWQAQTPQMFRFGLLRDALQQAIDNGREITDEASAIELAGYPVQMVLGHRDNIKITHPEDLSIAQAILREQSQQA